MRISKHSQELVERLELQLGCRTNEMRLSICIVLLARELSRQRLAAKPYMPLLETVIEDSKQPQLN